MWRRVRAIWSGACQWVRNTCAALSTSPLGGWSAKKRRMILPQMNFATRGWLAMRSRMSRPSLSAGCSG